MLTVNALAIPEVKEIVPAKFGDSRGFFSETYNQLRFAEHGIDLTFVQDNQSFSAEAGTLRGLHYQAPPFAQDKLVRVLRGAILDVAVDLRRGSPFYGKSVSLEVSAAKWNQILVPIGFAHGFLTLEPDTEVLYKVTSYYSKEHDAGLRWNDPDLAVNWRLNDKVPHLSAKDDTAPFFRDFVTPFIYPTGNEL